MRILVNLFGLLLITALMACGGGKATTRTEVPGGGPSSDRRAEVMALFMDATRARLGGQLPQAVQLYQQCLKLDPSNGAAHFELAKLYHQAQQYDPAVDHAKRAVAVDKENIWYHFLLADLYEQGNRPADAAAVYKEVLARWPERYEVYFDLANALAYSGKLTEAQKVYADMEQRFGLTDEVIAEQFNFLVNTNQLDEAERLVQRAVEAHPNEAHYLGMLAELHDQKGAHDKALACYKKALELDPGNSMMRIALAEHYYGTGRMEEAYSELGEAFLDPDLDIDAKMQVLIGFYEMTEREGENPNDRPDLIRRSYTLIDALERAHPESGKPHTIHGDFLLRDGKFEEARSEFRKALVHEKDRFPIHLQLLQLDLQLGDHEALHTDAEAAIALFPTSPELYLYNGIALSQLGRHDQAAETLITGRDLVVDNPPLLAQFWSSLGDAYNEAKQFGKSDQAYDKALALEPNNTGTLNNYAYYLSLRKDQLEKAERMSRRSNELAPGQPTYQDTYAWVLFQLGRYADARTWMEKALAGSPDPDGVLLEHYGDILFELGETTAAVEQWKKAFGKEGASELLERKINEGKRLE